MDLIMDNENISIDVEFIDVDQLIVNYTSDEIRDK